MNGVSHVAPANPTAEAAQSGKLTRTARQFEAILLNSLLGPLQHSFSSLGGKKTDSGSDNYSYLGMQALASALAARGGIGIADLIVRSLHKPGAVAAPHNGEEKSLAGGAPLERLF